MLKVISTLSNVENLKISLDDEKISKELESGNIFKNLPCGTLSELSNSLIYVHKYFCFDFTLKTSNKKLISLIKENLRKEKICEQSVFNNASA